jgi:GWxTD domain-containing protein
MLAFLFRTFIKDSKLISMKRSILALLFLIISFQAYSISGGYDYYIFYTAEGKPYVEVYYWVEGRTIEYKKISDAKKQGELEITIMIGLQDTSKVFSYEKIKLQTLEFNATDSLMSDIYDVKRIMIPAGVSYLELSVTDLNATTTNRFITKDTLTAVDASKADLFVSNIQLIDFVIPTENDNRFSKGGFDILPYHGNYFASDQGKLIFYTEINNAAKTLNPGGKYLMNCYLENASTGMQLEDFFVRKRMKAEDFTVVMSEFPIANLGPGLYNFVVEIRDSLNQFKAKESTTIIRENLYAELTEDAYKTISIEQTWADALNPDSLEEYLHSLRPICEGNEYQFVKNILKENDKQTMRQFLYAFWTSRYPDEPAFPYKSYSEFKSYNNLVEYVNDAFSTTINKGYLTERGRVFLRYGAPNSISQRHNEPSAYPYEIWYYYKLNAQTKVKFVFYSDDIVTNDFRLLHADLRGEIQNRQWEMILFSRNNTYKGDQNDMNPNYGSWSRDLYNNPR